MEDIEVRHEIYGRNLPQNIVKFQLIVNCGNDKILSHEERGYISER
jgi:hypothetical protein